MADADNWINASSASISLASRCSRVCVSVRSCERAVSAASSWSASASFVSPSFVVSSKS